MIAVIITCYNPKGGRRDGYAMRTISSLTKNLDTAEALRLIVADDGSYDMGYIHTMCEIANDVWDAPTEVSVVARKGIGGSLNNALQLVKDDELWIYTTDDWLLEAPLSLDKAHQLIITEKYDYVRLLPIHPDLTCRTRFTENTGWWLHIYQIHGGFAFATRPFLATKNFYNSVGPFPERLNAYNTERLYADAVKELPQLRLACAVDMHGPWVHVGEYEVGTIEPSNE